MKVTRRTSAFAAYNNKDPEVVVIEVHEPKNKRKRTRKKPQPKKAVEANNIVPVAPTKSPGRVGKKKAQKGKKKQLKKAAGLMEGSTCTEAESTSATSSGTITNGNGTPLGAVRELMSTTLSDNDITTAITPIRAKGIDSVKDGKRAFAWMMYPMDIDKFFNTVWEKKPIYIERNHANYFASLLTSEQIDSMLRENEIHYTKNIDITSYSDGERQTHNPVGRALPAVVWDYYINGCSVRMLNPQTFHEPIWELNAHLQEFMGCFVGANVYLTPPGSQGFAPHYDDIEAFILQVEGEKHWKLYAPMSAQEMLPRTSSQNFTQDEIGDPMLQVKLKAGDMLYFPRGTIHQASTPSHTHSLHITLSCYQKNSWADLLEKLVPAALSNAIENDVEFRQGLPRNYLNYMGIAHSDIPTPESQLFKDTVQRLMGKLFMDALIHPAVDQMGKDFIHNALPPVINNRDKERSVFGGGFKMVNGKVTNVLQITSQTRVKLVRKHALRLLLEDDVVRVYYSVDNSREYQAVQQQYLEIEASQAQIVEHLIQNYPAFSKVENLPSADNGAKVQLIGDLWEKGLLITKEKLGLAPEVEAS